MMKARAIFLTIALGAAGEFGLSTGTSAEASGCAADGKVQFICGVSSPEDLVRIPGAEWVVASGYSGGPIQLVGTRDYRTVSPFSPASPKAKRDPTTYPSCPCPLQPNE